MTALPIKSLLLSFALAAVLQADWFGCRLKVGTDADSPPMSFMDEKGKLQGIEIDFARALEKETGCRIAIKTIPWQRLGEALEKGEIDLIMSGLSVTKARAKRMLFTRPWWETTQMALVRAGTHTLPNPSSRGVGMRVGFIARSTGELLAKRKFAEAKHRAFARLESGIEALVRGENDYFFIDAPTVWYYTSTRPLDHIAGWNVPYTRESLAWAVSVDNQALKERLDRIIITWRKSGFIGRTIRKWIPFGIVAPGGDTPVRFDR